MASKVKGLTIDIGGDTSGLQKALSEVNKVTSRLTSELNSVNKALKFDPKNTELLKQKQDILNKEIEAIKDRVQLTAYQKNQCKMKAGRPIALKGKYSDVLALELQGLSDAEICQKLGGISKTTLWRYRKQANEDKK